MCDHLLDSTQDRLAQEGEDLTLHRFESGEMGFASDTDLIEYEISKQKAASSFWGTVKDWLLLPSGTQTIPAVCVTPGTTLLLTDIPTAVQSSLCIEESEIVVFSELHSPAYSFRDALLLPNTTRVLLQDLPEGMHALVLSVSPQSFTETTPAGAGAASRALGRPHFRHKLRRDYGPYPADDGGPRVPPPVTETCVRGPGDK